MNTIYITRLKELIFNWHTAIPKLWHTNNNKYAPLTSVMEYNSKYWLIFALSINLYSLKFCQEFFMSLDTLFFTKQYLFHVNSHLPYNLFFFFLNLPSVQQFLTLQICSTDNTEDYIFKNYMKNLLSSQIKVILIINKIIFFSQITWNFKVFSCNQFRFNKATILPYKTFEVQYNNLFKHFINSHYFSIYVLKKKSPLHLQLAPT